MDEVLIDDDTSYSDSNSNGVTGSMFELIY